MFILFLVLNYLVVSSFILISIYMAIQYLLTSNKVISLFFPLLTFLLDLAKFALLFLVLILTSLNLNFLPFFPNILLKLKHVYPNFYNIPLLKILNLFKLQNSSLTFYLFSRGQIMRLDV